MEEFRRAADLVLAQSGELDRAAADARLALARAEVAEGPEAVRSAALASRLRVSVEARPATVTGVPIAEIQYAPIGIPRFARGYPPTAGSPHLDHVAARFEAQVELLLRMVDYEVRLRRISEEIGITTRRVNALDTVVIPRLEQQIRAIHVRLEEVERQDRFRLKRFKERRALRTPPGRPHERSR
jgi:V/A-type H+-transporting ATPase subunit D